MSTRVTRSSVKSGSAAVIAPMPAELPVAKKRVVRKKANALADVTNAAPVVDTAMTDCASAPVKSTTISMSSMLADIDMLTAEKDVEPTPALTATVVVVSPTTVVPAAPQLACAAIDPSITALRVVREPIPAFVRSVVDSFDSDEEEIIPSSRRVQLVYGENDELIGAQDVAPLPCFHTGDEVVVDEEAQEDLTKLGEVERMVSEEVFVAPAPLVLDHAAPIAKRDLQGKGYSSGFLRNNVISSSTVRSVKLDQFESELPAHILAAPASTSSNVAKVTGFVHSIDVNRVQSKKL